MLDKELMTKYFSKLISNIYNERIRSFVRRVNLLLNILNFKTHCFFKISDFENSLFSRKEFENKTTIKNRHLIPGH